MVKNFSSLLHSPNEKWIGSSGNHSNMVKFIAASDDVYRKLVGYIEECLKSNKRENAIKCQYTLVKYWGIISDA